MKTVFVLHLDDVILLTLLSLVALSYAVLVFLDFLSRRRDRKKAEVLGKLSADKSLQSDPEVPGSAHGNRS